jgi:hypothetical protein
MLRKTTPTKTKYRDLFPSEIMLGEVDLQVVRLTSTEGAQRFGDLDYPPVHSIQREFCY